MRAGTRLRPASPLPLAVQPACAPAGYIICDSSNRGRGGSASVQERRGRLLAGCWHTGEQEPTFRRATWPAAPSARTAAGSHAASAPLQSVRCLQPPRRSHWRQAPDLAALPGAAQALPSALSARHCRRQGNSRSTQACIMERKGICLAGTAAVIMTHGPVSGSHCICHSSDICLGLQGNRTYGPCGRNFELTATCSVESLFSLSILLDAACPGLHADAGWQGLRGLHAAEKVTGARLSANAPHLAGHGAGCGAPGPSWKPAGPGMQPGAPAALPCWSPLSWRLCIEPLFWAAASKPPVGDGMLLSSGCVPNAGRSPVMGLGSPPAVGGVPKPPACCTPRTDRRLPSSGPPCHYSISKYMGSICLQLG